MTFIQSRLEKIAAAFRSFVYRLIKRIWLWSIRQESLDDYVESLLMHELIYSDGKFAADTLANYMRNSGDYFDKHPEYKKKVYNLIEAIEAMSRP